MNDLLYKLLAFIVPVLLSQIIYSKVDGRYEITNKISLKIPVQDKWKASFCVCCILIIILIIWIINSSYVVTDILNGGLVGIGTIMANKMSIKR
jgi:hypothetical protein